MKVSLNIVLSGFSLIILSALKKWGMETDMMTNRYSFKACLIDYIMEEAEYSTSLRLP